MPHTVPSDQEGPGFPGRRLLIRAGIADTQAALDTFRQCSSRGMSRGIAEAVTGALVHACDPDAALYAVGQLYARDETREALPSTVQPNSDDVWGRLVKTLGASKRIGSMVEQDADLLSSVTGEYFSSSTWDKGMRADAFSAAASCGGNETAAVNALRHEYWKQIIAVAAFDMAHNDPAGIQPEVSSYISDLVDCALDAAVQIALRSVGASEDILFSVIGMGKLGAREINYVSDVDLIYVAEPRHEGVTHAELVKKGTAAGIKLQKICQSVIPGVNEPPLWKVDCALRPEGKAGPLVRTLESHYEYYQKWAENWEFQALLKARHVAGDPELGMKYVDSTRQLVWNASARKNFVFDCRKMRERVESLIPEQQKDLEIKLGRGGLRDVEFTVQMLQLVHGRTDRSLRVSSTLDALQRLSAGGYMSRKQSEALSADYRFERVLEHRQQLWNMHRTHLFPDLGQANRGGIEKPRNIDRMQLHDNKALVRLARACSLSPEKLLDSFDAARREIRRLHMDIYYRPMLGDISHMADEEIRLSPAAMAERYESIGFADPQAAAEHVRYLTRGISRAAKINRILLPAVLLWLGDGQNPDMGLLQWRRLAENYGGGGPYLGFLRDSPLAAKRLCIILANSRFLGDALNRSAESLTWLGDDAELQPHTRGQLDTLCEGAYKRFPENMRSFAALIRSMRRREIERIGLGWMSGITLSSSSLQAMTDVYDAAIDISLRWAVRHQCRKRGIGENRPPAQISVIAMGRYGGREVNFCSDADIMMIYEPVQDAGREADEAADPRDFSLAVVNDLRSILSGPLTSEAKIDLDLDLRPEGKNGPLIRSYKSYEDYYAHWAQMWEHQALLRARYAAGDRELAERFLERVADPLRYPAQAPGEDDLAQIRTLKARMESERLPRGIRRDRHLKLGKGGLSDVEWTVQLLQLQHAHQCEDTQALPDQEPQPGGTDTSAGLKHHEDSSTASLRTTSTLQALSTLENSGVLSHEDAAVLRSTWQVCTDARNAHYLWSGRANQADIIPDDSFSLGGVAACMGRSAHQGQEFANELLQKMRRCREVAERLFYADAHDTR